DARYDGGELRRELCIGRTSHADEGTEQAIHRGGPRHADGRAASPLLAAIRHGQAAPRSPHARRHAAGGAPGRLSRSKRSLRIDPGILPAPEREPPVGNSRGGGAALSLSWVALRQRGSLPRAAGRIAGQHLQGPDRGPDLSRRGAGRNALGLAGTGAAPAGSPMGVVRAGWRAGHRLGGAALQLAPDHGEQSRPRAYGVAPPILHELRVGTPERGRSYSAIVLAVARRRAAP